MSLSRLALRLATMEALRPTACLAPATSATPWTIGAAGLALFAVPAGLAFARGLPVVVAADANHWARGTVYTYDAGAGLLAVNVSSTAGSGTFSAWTISAPFPTLAGGMVFDSRLDPLDDMRADEQKPVIVVYTEEDNSDPGQAAGGPPFKHTVDLVVEVSVVALAQVMVDGVAQYVPATPATDAQSEASLDLLEAQVMFVLFASPIGYLWQKVTARRVIDIRSLPHRSSEEEVRIAMRSIRMKVTMNPDKLDAAPAVEPVGIARLPQPLQDVFAALAPTAYGATLAAGLAVSAPVMPIAVPLKTIAANVGVDRTDGSIDIAASVDNIDQG